MGFETANQVDLIATLMTLAPDLVDVGAAHDDVGVVNNHHLRVDVNRESETFSEYFGHRLGGRLETVKIFARQFTLT